MPDATAQSMAQRLVDLALDQAAGRFEDEVERFLAMLPGSRDHLPLWLEVSKRLEDAEDTAESVAEVLEAHGRPNVSWLDFTRRLADAVERFNREAHLHPHDQCIAGIVATLRGLSGDLLEGIEPLNIECCSTWVDLYNLICEQGGYDPK